MKTLILGIALLLASEGAIASTPKVPITGFGKYYDVPEHATIEQGTQFKIAFDVASAATAGEQNHNMNSLARFINMHIAHGVKAENIKLALVAHGKASVDVLKNSVYHNRFNIDNKNQALILQLIKNNTQVYVCGQSATHYNVTSEQLIPGVKMALSAMTAHAQLQQQGYTLNPF